MKCGASNGALTCDRETGHSGNHRGYNEQVDEAMFWPSVVTCAWHRDGDGGWQGSCGIRIEDQLVRSGQVSFCPLCGKPVAW